MPLLSGLGIGTTPSALISHGIDTTVVEIDPVVRNYAMEYFDLPGKHIPVIEDAVKYAARTAKDTKQRFDYIVHDVFTGGAEPVDLFTIEFFQDLHTMLKPNGAVAIVSLIFIKPEPKQNLTKPSPELRRRPPPPLCAPRRADHKIHLPNLPHLPRERTPRRYHARDGRPRLH
jgi:spermidine synthase